MAIIKGLQTGFQNSTSPIGDWEVPQQEGDDRPRGNITYDSWRMSKGQSFNGIKKDLYSFNLINLIPNLNDFDVTITKGKMIIFGHMIKLEEDLELSGVNQIIVGINRNPHTLGEEDGGFTYIDASDTIREPVRETLEQDSGIYEVVVWEASNGELLYKLPESKTIANYKNTTLLITGGNNIYSVDFPSISNEIISSPLSYNIRNKSVSLWVEEIADNSNQDILRFRKGGNFVQFEFDTNTLSWGQNLIFFYVDSETNKITATVGKARKGKEK